MGQSFDSDRPGSAARLPPVAPPPRKVSNGSVPDMNAFREGGSSPNAFGPLPRVSAPPPMPTRTLPPVSAPAPKRPPPPPSRRDPLTESITHVHKPGPAADTFRDARPRPSLSAQFEDAVTNPADGRDEGLEWDEDEESTHVFSSSAPPPFSSLQGSLSYREPPVSQPAYPASQPAYPASQPAYPASQPSYPASQPSYPASHPMNAPPSNDTLRLDALGAGPVASVPGASSAPPRPLAGQSGMSPMFPPPPPIPSITNARPIEGPVAGIAHAIPISQAVAPGQEGAAAVLREHVPFTRLPTGNPHSSTELAIRKPTLPSNYVPPQTLGASALPGAVAYPPAERRDGKRWILGVAALAALLSLGALLTFMITRRPGGMKVEVKDASGASVPKASVYVDGRKVCDATPCSIRDLQVGKYAVRVMANDQTLDPLDVQIEAGDVTPVTFNLTSRVATIAASTDQAGVHLHVDGVDRGVLPLKLTDIGPGKHTLKLDGNRFKAYEKTVEVKAGETLQLDVPKLQVTKGRATVNLKTAGATVTVVRTDGVGAPRLVEGPFPRDIEVDTTAGAWKLVAKKRGLPDFVAALDFADGVPERTIDVELREERPADPEPVASEPPPSNAPSHTPSRTTTVARTTPERTPDADPPAAQPSGNGFLNINSIPASRVLLDGSPLGETPKTGVSVSAGTHTVTFIHPELGKKSVSVKVGPGETKTASARLR